MVQRYFDHFDKNNLECGIHEHLKVFLFFQQISTGKDRSICCPTGITGFPCKRKVLNMSSYVFGKPLKILLKAETQMQGKKADKVHGMSKSLTESCQKAYSNISFSIQLK